MIFLLLACSLPSGGPDWKPVNVGALKATLANPTASRSATQAWLLSHAEDLKALVDTATTLTNAMDSVAAPADAPEVARDTAELSGTEVYLKIACPGPGVGPDPDFAHGRVEIESPLLSIEDIEEVGVQGDMLITAVACEDGDERYDGLAPAWYDAPQELLVLDGAMDLTTSTETVSLAIRAVLADPWGFVIPLSTGDSLSLDVDPKSTSSGRLRYADGEILCALATPVSCAMR